MKQNKLISLLLCFIITVFLIIISLFVGAANINIKDIISFTFGGTTNNTVSDVILYARLPRIIAAYFCGIAFALAGLLLQVTLNNPLASPGVIGVNSGAGFFVVISSVLFPSVFYTKVIFAFIGAIFTALLVYGIAKKTGNNRSTIVMSGIAISSLMSAGTDAVITLKPEVIIDKTSFYIGGFSTVNIELIKYTVVFIFIGLIGAFLLSSRLNVLLLGDEVAISLGLNVTLCRFLSIMCGALLAASAVCIGGLIGFVGLIVPHIVRNIFDTDYKWLIPFTALIGGEFLLFCDTLARIIFIPYEIPVGIILSFLGAPFFLYQLFNKKRRAEI
ncbi:FecCD family ABC transporter permease [Defluviitalea phaphyphila]|uniref:FecCD family ABC transporter permease n=1 Tax=Defluviitalea phaphyphila TaxID=1473580 RepID=UPI0007DBF1A5|nr:iron ABC transporter permease [Defluviitalea phaphyphila]